MTKLDRTLAADYVSRKVVIKNCCTRRSLLQGRTWTNSDSEKWRPTAERKETNHPFPLHRNNDAIGGRVREVSEVGLGVFGKNLFRPCGSEEDRHDGNQNRHLSRLFF